MSQNIIIYKLGSKLYDLDMLGNKINVDEDKTNEFLDSRYIEKVFPQKERVKEMLMSGKRLTFYFGIDPTGPDIHLGNSTNLLLAKKLIGLGHKIIFLIGDFTARIGDPTGKESTRKSLSDTEIKKNTETYLKQVHKILPKKSFDLRYNSKWLRKMSFEDVIKLASHVTIQQMIARNMFQERIRQEKPIYEHEFLYPLAQGYDSVAMNVDGEIGGNDQTFNMLVGRDLVKSLLNKEKIVIATKLLEDPVTGKKIMNKSEGHYVSLNDSPQDIFGKIMAMADSMVIPLYAFATEVSDGKISEMKVRLEKGENPKSVKQELAFELVRMYHGEKEAEKARDEWERIFSKRELPEKIEEVPGDGVKLVDFITEHALAVSSSEAKRLLDQGAVSVNGEVLQEWGHTLNKGDIVRVGPRKFLKVF